MSHRTSFRRELATLYQGLAHRIMSARQTDTLSTALYHRSSENLRGAMKQLETVVEILESAYPGTGARP